MTISDGDCSWFDIINGILVVLGQYYEGGVVPFSMQKNGAKSESLVGCVASILPPCTANTPGAKQCIAA